jgi:hypothetical protein
MDINRRGMKKLLENVTDVFELDRIYKRKEIIELFKNNGVEKPRNITSMTYNRWNIGMSNVHLDPLFEYLGRNQYRFLGRLAPFTGDILHDPKAKGSLEYKIGCWINGRVYDYEDRLSGFKFDLEEVPLAKHSSLVGAQRLNQLGFNCIGRYTSQGSDIRIQLDNGIKKTERVSLVYALVVSNDVKYLGKTVQGYIRPISYHKNNVMHNVKAGIEALVKSGTAVEVWCRRFDEPLKWNDLELNIIEAVEQALISELDPDWNRYKHRS